MKPINITSRLDIGNRLIINKIKYNYDKPPKTWLDFLFDVFFGR